MNKKLIYLILANLFALSIEVKLQAEEVRSYFGISAGYSLITGSFNGSEFFQTDDHIVLVPKIKPSFGIGGVVGIGTNRFALDIGYYMTKSDYTSMDEGYAGKCTTHLIRFLGFTAYFNKYAEGTVRPYIDVDLSIATSVFDKIAYSPYNIENPLSAKYGGIIIGLGAGTLIKLSDKLALDIRILPELYVGSTIRVKGYKWYEIAKFGNFLLQSTVGIKYYFKGI
jgi:hypothetical protein